MTDHTSTGSPAAGTHTPTPWFVSGVRFRMNGGEWHNINRYDDYKQQDENIACVGYDPRTGLGHADAHFIVRAVNNHKPLLDALELAEAVLNEIAIKSGPIEALAPIRAALSAAKGET